MAHILHFFLPHLRRATPDPDKSMIPLMTILHIAQSPNIYGTAALTAASRVSRLLSAES